jgi:hypothetical protein
MSEYDDAGPVIWDVWLERATGLAVVVVIAVGVLFLCGGGR